MGLEHISILRGRKMSGLGRGRADRHRSRQKNLLKCIAVDEARQGEGITASLITALRQDAFDAGYEHLFLYTKPGNKFLFSSLFFYPVAKTDQVLLMESRRNGVQRFVEGLPRRIGWPWWAFTDSNLSPGGSADLLALTLLLYFLSGNDCLKG